MQYINAPNIILGIMDPLDQDNTKNQVILILKYYLYKCRCLGDKPSINGGIKYLKYCIKIEKTTINFLSSTKREYICKKWLPFETVLDVWNFNVMLQNVCFDKLIIFRLCKLYIHVICFCICICLCFSLKINKVPKNVERFWDDDQDKVVTHRNVPKFSLVQSSYSWEISGGK